MAIRSMYVSKVSYPFYKEIHVELDWFGGFALSQKRKCEIGLHKNFLSQYPKEKPLEISSASTNTLGKKLSAMNLKKQVIIHDADKKLAAISSVESVFQSSRIYVDGNNQIGPFPEYILSPGKESKKRVKEASKGLHSYKYYYDGSYFFAPDYHISLFYDYVYMNALLEEENKEAMLELLLGGYSAFSDLATLALNSQARSCAIFVGLYKAGLLDMVRNKESYLRLFRTKANGEADLGAYENVQLLKSDKVELLSPIIPCIYHKDDVENIYLKKYSHLTNRKTDVSFVPYYLNKL